ncbi:uncharacterized protein LOC129926828 [Biomphalaria glabrata]|uniref:Uncharacterized protein LOC129926828 n=1 Tax=Biomphalaria glabrata TaxID=6526 RepID=A0A9W3APN3_BIOGL|nr:uncharacterized protein LOC129926828 [Biomphalaria glabrata]
MTGIYSLSLGLVYLPLISPLTSTLWSAVYNTDTCTCPCSAARYNLSAGAAITEQEAKEKAAELEKQLTVDKKATSFLSRTKHSQPDPRTTATSIGAVGSIIISLVFIVLCVSDITSCMKKGKVQPRKKRPKKRVLNAGVVDESHQDEENIRIITDVSLYRSLPDIFQTRTPHSSADDIHTFSVAKLLHAVNKSVFHFQGSTFNTDDVQASSFPPLSEPLLSGPRKSGMFFRGPFHRQAQSENFRLQDCLQQDFRHDSTADIFGVNGIQAPYQ